MVQSLIVDISHHQPSCDIDWERAAKEVALFIIRVQYGSRSVDREYKNHVANCKKHGIPFGHYAYGRFVSVNDAKVEARDFLSRIDNDAKFLVLDAEEMTARIQSDFTPAIQSFIDVCKGEGHRTGLYTGEFFYKNYGLNKIKSDFLWIARYSKNAPSVSNEIWQYTSKGIVSWYKGNLDLNILNKPLDWFIGKSDKVENQAPVQNAYEKELTDSIDFLQWKKVISQDRRNENLTRGQMFLMMYRFYLNVIKPSEK